MARVKFSHLVPLLDWEPCMRLCSGSGLAAVDSGNSLLLVPRCRRDSRSMRIDDLRFSSHDPRVAHLGGSSPVLHDYYHAGRCRSIDAACGDDGHPQTHRASKRNAARGPSEIPPRLESNPGALPLKSAQQIIRANRPLKNRAIAGRKNSGSLKNVRAIHARPTTQEWKYTTIIIRAAAIIAALASVVILISYVMHVQNLQMHPEPAATSSVAIFSGGFFRRG